MRSNRSNGEFTPARRGRWPRYLALGVAAILAIVAAALIAAAWLVGTTSGLRASTQLLAWASRGTIVVDAPAGRLVGPLQLARVEAGGVGYKIVAENVELRWQPRALLAGRLDIDTLRIATLRYLPLVSSENEPPPDEIVLPFAVRVGELEIGTFEYGNVFAAKAIVASLTSDRRHHAVELLRGESGSLRVQARAHLDGAAPITLAAHADLATVLAEKPLALEVDATGPLAAVELRVFARSGASGSAEIVLTPFAEAPFSRARIALDEVDPAAWVKDAPSARLEVRADVVPQTGTGGASGAIGNLEGELRVRNRSPGPLDRKRLPFTALTSRVDWQGSVAHLENLRVSLPGKGELNGRGVWQHEELALALDASQLDAARLHSSLLTTRLQGSITARVSARSQSAKINLHDRRFSILADASRAADSVEVKRLDLVSAASRLSAQGKLTLTGTMAFDAKGEVVDFDPSRFAKVPAGRLNGHFAAGGKLSPHLVAEASFTLGESRFAGQPFSGQGEVTVDWPLVPKLDVALVAGPNRLTAQGAFARGAGKLTVDVQAPNLSPYGLEGGISGEVELAGGIDSPRLSARLAAERIGLPGSTRLAGVALQLQAGGELASPLAVDLAVARVDQPDRSGVVRGLRLTGSGTTRLQRWQAKADLADAREVTLAAEGGLQSALSAATPPLWRGQLTALTLSERGDGRNARRETRLRLDAPAPLVLGATHWALGPAALAGETPDWRATLRAEADSRRLEAHATATGERIGRIEVDAGATMKSAWSLDVDAPWQARAKTQIADLDWVASLVDPGWQSAGRLDGDLTLAGTPSQPIANGRFRGSDLALRRPEQKLDLERGELDVDLADNRLHVRRLVFDSVLQTMPSPLRRASGEAVRSLAAKPGRVEIAGELELDRNQGASSASVDVRLDRVGVWQLPEQWLLVSGNGRLAWRAGALQVRGSAKADAGYWQLAPAGAPRLSDDVVVRRAGEAPKASGALPNVDLDVTATLGDSLFFSGAGLTSRLVGEIRLRAQGRDLPRASGTIATRDGRYEAYGQQLTVEHGILSFQGLLDNPALDIRAVRKGLPVEAGVQVGGSARRPIVKLVSDPDLPDAEKLAWLVLGHGSEQMGVGDAATLLSAASGVLGSNSGGVVAQIKRRFGVDELGVRQGQLGDSGRQSTSRIATSGVDTPVASGDQIFIAGKRIASNAVLSYEQVLGKAESIVKLTVALTRRVSLVARAGSDNAIDLFYTLTFGEKPKPEAPAPERTNPRKSD